MLAHSLQCLTPRFYVFVRAVNSYGCVIPLFRAWFGVESVCVCLSSWNKSRHSYSVCAMTRSPSWPKLSRQLVYGHFVYDTSSTDISSTDISSTMTFLAEIEAGVMKRILYQ